jgi:hypothetical protein
MLLSQMPGDRLGAGIQPLPGQIPAQPEDQLDGRRWGRRRLVVRPAGPWLERLTAFFAVRATNL